MIEMIRAEVERMKGLTGFSLSWVLERLGIGRSTYHRWLRWRPSAPKGFVHPCKPLKREAEAVVGYARTRQGTGYKKICYEMLDGGMAALTESQVYRILSAERMLDKWGRTKGAAEAEYRDKPTKPDEHWHTDLMYVKVVGVWCFLMAVLDGYSRYVVGWAVLTDMTAKSVSLFMRGVIEKNPSEGVRLIHDNGSQLVSKDFRAVLASGNIAQVRIRRNHPQSNGKAERFNGLLRQECLRPESPVTIKEVELVVGRYIDEYNNRRLHSSIDYMRPVDYYKGNPDKVRRLRAEKLRSAKETRMAENRLFNQALKGQTTAYFDSSICPI